MQTLKILLLIISISFANNTILFAQIERTDTVVTAFWNLENLFDTVHDINKSDKEFTPEGTKHWTEERLGIKLNNLSKVIASMNNGKCPDILGVCEVEHEALLDSIVAKTPLYDIYKVAYAEAPDKRGIDNGLIYNSNKFTLLAVKADTVKLSDGYLTRLILNVNLISKITKDTISVFVNHWPSRRGGQEKSEPNRIQAAAVLKKAVSSYFTKDTCANILIMGDFNDEPNNKSILNTLKAKPIECHKKVFAKEMQYQCNLVNLSFPAFKKEEGSFNYKGNWNMLDQIIVSGSLIKNENINYICTSFKIYKPDFIVTQSGKYAGTPYPSFGGQKYIGGYSDHFPVIAKFVLKRTW